MSPRKTAKKVARKSGASTKKSAKKSSKPTAAAKKTIARKTVARKTVAKRLGTDGAAESGTGLRVRMYRVGFGDFFLVTVPTAAGDKFILIDCGVFKGKTGKGDIGSINEAVEDLFKTTNGELALVIMTHRHADHIAGFNKAEDLFRKFTASQVWMPYWEQFNDDKDSAHSLQFEIEQLAMELALRFRGREDDESKEALAMLEDATGIDFNATSAGPKKLSGNALALDILKNHLGAKGKKVRYYAAGDEPELPEELDGLSAVILGPPPKDAQVFMKLEDLKKGVGQYLDSTSAEDGSALRPFREQWTITADEAYPQVDLRDRPINYHDVIQHVARAQPSMLADAAKKVDDFLNNQSLVVLFKFAGKSLLFVGDAQAGNWEHWLYEADAPSSDPTKLGSIKDESQQILRTIDFYKVGHHGSTNATPIQAVEALSAGRKGDGFVAMCSTQPDVYGNPLKGTEVPRDPLMEALGGECDLVRSDAYAINTVANGTIEPGEGVPKPPKLRNLVKGDLYVEYSF
ncbi:MAG: MBL fold metallo-hydrolase [Pyrinomonadaceae bacterium]